MIRIPVPYLQGGDSNDDHTKEMYTKLNVTYLGLAFKVEQFTTLDIRIGIR